VPGGQGVARVRPGEARRRGQGDQGGGGRLMPDSFGTSGYQRLRSFLGTDQAAGSEISEVVPTGKFWRILAVRAQLVTSGTAGNRFPRLEIDDGTNIFYNSQMSQA